jgi:hypothetical protein
MLLFIQCSLDDQARIASAVHAQSSISARHDRNLSFAAEPRCESSMTPFDSLDQGQPHESIRSQNHARVNHCSSTRACAHGPPPLRDAGNRSLVNAELMSKDHARPCGRGCRAYVHMLRQHCSIDPRTFLFIGSRSIARWGKLCTSITAHAVVHCPRSHSTSLSLNSTIKDKFKCRPHRCPRLHAPDLR